MTVKSVIDIDVDDSKFKRFQELFDKYNDQLAKTPNAWKAVGGAQAEMATQFERMTAAMMAQAHHARESSEDDKKRLNTLSLSERLWTSMAKSTGTFAKNIMHAGESLLRWTGLLGAVSGLLGAGGLFGIDRMAARVAGERRSSTGLGMSIGQEKAFGVNFSRFVNPGSFLSGINNAVSNIANQGPLWSLGVNPNQSTEAVALATLKAVRAKAQSMPVNQLGLLENMYHLSELGLGVEDIRRLRSASPEEFAKQQRGYSADVGALGIDDKTGKAWQDFTTQMQRAGETIFKTFVTGLEPLAPALEHLSTAFTKFLETLLKSPIIKTAIDDLAGWLENFSGEISTPAFLENVQGFIANIGAIAQALASALGYLRIPLGPVADIGGAAVSMAWRKNFQANPSQAQYLALLAQANKEFKLPAGTLENQWMAESGGSLSPPNSSKGAIGPFQFMPGTAKELGINPRDPLQAAYGAGQYDAQLRAKYHGDMAKMLAAYNMGPSALDQVLSKHGGADWLGYTSKETRDYVTKQMGVKVVVQNNTGGNAVTSISALTPPPGIALP